MMIPAQVDFQSSSELISNFNKRRMPPMAKPILEKKRDGD